MANQDTSLQTKLEGNSKLGNRQIDPETQELRGFDVINPNGSTLHIELSAYSRTSEASGSANKLRETVFENYQFLVENVPAATAVFESNAREFPKGVTWQKPGAIGLWNKSSPGKGDNTENPQTAPVIMTGNLNLPSGADPIQSSGGASHEDARAQEYFSKDKTWNMHLSPEALLHEHVHATPEYQNWQSTQAQLDKNAKSGINIPRDNLMEVIRLENEGKAIEFVNKTMLSPLGIPERDPNAYRTVKPSNITVQPRDNYSEHDKNRLHNGPIPEELQSYSHPRAVPLQKHSSINDKIDANLTAEHKIIALSRYINELPKHQRQPYEKIALDYANNKGIFIEETLQELA